MWVDVEEGLGPLVVESLDEGKQGAEDGLDAGGWVGLWLLLDVVVEGRKLGDAVGGEVVLQDLEQLGVVVEGGGPLVEWLVGEVVGGLESDGDQREQTDDLLVWLGGGGDLVLEDLDQLERVDALLTSGLDDNLQGGEESGVGGGGERGKVHGLVSGELGVDVLLLWGAAAGTAELWRGGGGLSVKRGWVLSELGQSVLVLPGDLSDPLLGGVEGPGDVLLLDLGGAGGDEVLDLRDDLDEDVGGAHVLLLGPDEQPGDEVELVEDGDPVLGHLGGLDLVEDGLHLVEQLVLRGLDNLLSFVLAGLLVGVGVAGALQELVSAGRRTALAELGLLEPVWAVWLAVRVVRVEIGVGIGLVALVAVEHGVVGHVAVVLAGRGAQQLLLGGGQQVGLV